MNADARILLRLGNRRGNALLVAYLAIVAFLGIGAAFLLLVTNEGRVVERQRLSTLAFHIAEAGIERGLRSTSGLRQRRRDAQLVRR